MRWSELLLPSYTEPSAPLAVPPFLASCSPGQQSQAMHAVLGIVRLSMQCPCLAAVPFSCPLLGNSPHITSRQPHLAFQLQPARMIRSFDSPILISAVEAWD